MQWNKTKHCCFARSLFSSCDYNRLVPVSYEFPFSIKSFNPPFSAGHVYKSTTLYIYPLTPELNPSAQRYLTRFFTGDFASWTVHFVNIWVKNQQIHQLHWSTVKN
jgi:hypothetical protein